MEIFARLCTRAVHGNHNGRDAHKNLLLTDSISSSIILSQTQHQVSSTKKKVSSKNTIMKMDKNMIMEIYIKQSL